ncbi:hypothetical protein E4U42_006722 [Claviceps africana]|uniref:Uncharacterized protein n=1 Tax=Claviceps africana TaxID=83212 RepID=A0A8K0J202_9HYPO|nr:hypothetical protein E4U42_006722 [Claviceps africana]
MDVIPCTFADLGISMTNIRTRTFFIVKECLDEDALRTSLDCLIRNHWRKLGGRLVARKDGHLEYHIPKTFDQDYALFNWSAQEHHQSIEKVASAIRSPPLDKGPQFLPSLSIIDSWFRPADWPYDRRDGPPDAPMLYVHVSLFDDATVITIGHPHSLADQMGLANIIKAWMGLIEGKEPPAFVGYEGNDLLPGSDKTYKDYPKSEIFRKGQQRIYRTGERPLVLLPLLPDLLLRKEESHLLFLPLQLVGALRDKWSASLAEEHDDFTRISDGDVIVALLSKLSRIHKKTPRTMALSQAVNLRGLVPALSSPEDRDGYIHNALRNSTANLRIGPATPAREIAYANRKALEKSLDARDIEISMAVQRETVRIRQTSHICEPNGRSYHVSNWCAAWKDVDFGPAVRQENKGSGKPKLLVLGQSGERAVPLRLSALVLSKTEEGYWMQFSASVAGMQHIREYLSQDPTLQKF